MRSLLLTGLGVIDVCANLPYIIDTYKGKTKPNIASWSTLTLINGLTAFAALASKDALNTTILGFSYLVGSLTILSLALLKGTRGYTWFDGICQTLALIGLSCSYALRDPNIALATVVVVGELAAIPMYRHAYLYPDEETWSTFLIASLVALGTLCLASNISFASIAVPIDLAIGNGFITALILIRRHKHRFGVTKAQLIV